MTFACNEHDNEIRESVLGDLDKRIHKHIIPIGFGGKTLLRDIIDQMNQMREVYKTLYGKGERK